MLRIRCRRGRNEDHPDPGKRDRTDLQLPRGGRWKCRSKEKAVPRRGAQKHLGQQTPIGFTQNNRAEKLKVGIEGVEP